jgi:exopolysaccharide production protein ExoY
MAPTSDTDLGCRKICLQDISTMGTLFAFCLKFGKRLSDFIGASLFLLTCLPLLIGLLALVSLEGKNPLFGHLRVGRDGKVFRCWKIRTMVPDAEQRLHALLARDGEARGEWAECRKLKRDPRITKFGNFLRKSSLDELPQFWNVLVGDMSMVGPRPVTLDELRLYGDAAEIYMSMRPGLTGPWQIAGRGEVSYGARIQMDTHYHANIFALSDIKIVLRTPAMVFRRTGS